MTGDEKPRIVKEVNLEFNNIGTEGGKSWDYNARVTLTSNTEDDKLDDMIDKAQKIIDKNKVKK
ncbi:MAG: hypothetical protein ACRD9Q_01215 [Nitrososphaeraceae archaeon]